MEETGLSSFSFFMSAGGPVMWIILFLSVLGIAIVIERAFFLMRLEKRFFLPDTEDVPQNAEAVRIFAERYVQSEISACQEDLPLLEIIIKVAPMLGLLGTVLGMVEMFLVLGTGGNIDTASVTGGIRVALFTTVAGLSCAIPLLAAHGLLNAAIDRREKQLDKAADLWIQKQLRRGPLKAVTAQNETQS